MKTRVLAVAVLVATSVACGPEEPAKAPTAPPPSQDVPPAPTAPPPVHIAEPQPTPPKAETPLPPPKPTTIPLGKTGDEKLDAALAPGDKAFEDGDYPRAIAAYDAAKPLAGKKAAALVGSARARVAKASPTLDFAAAPKNQDVLAGIRDLKRAAELEAGFGPAQVELGRALLVAGEGAQAEAALRKGVRLMPDEAEAHSALGVALLAIGKVEEAVTELTKARDLDPGSAARRGNLGTVLFMRGRVAEAIKEYEVEVRLSPDDARAHSDLGTALLAQSDFTRAVPELKRAIALDGKRATFRSNLGYALQLQGKLAEAIGEYREAIKLDAKLASAWINLATALSRDPKTRGEARQALKTAEKLDPSDPRVKANLEELDALEKGSPSKP